MQVKGLFCRQKTIISAVGRPETNDALVVEHLCDFEDHVGTDGVDAVPYQDAKVVNLAGLTSLKEYGAFRAKPG